MHGATIRFIVSGFVYRLDYILLFNEVFVLPFYIPAACILNIGSNNNNNNNNNIVIRLLLNSGLKKKFYINQQNINIKLHLY